MRPGLAAKPRRPARAKVGHDAGGLCLLMLLPSLAVLFIQNTRCCWPLSAVPPSPLRFSLACRFGRENVTCTDNPVVVQYLLCSDNPNGRECQYFKSLLEEDAREGWVKWKRAGVLIGVAFAAGIVLTLCTVCVARRRRKIALPSYSNV